MLETQVRSLGGEDPLEKEMATYSSILAWKIPWTEEPGRLQSIGLQRAEHDWACTRSHTHTHTHTHTGCLIVSGVNLPSPIFLSSCTFKNLRLHRGLEGHLAHSIICSLVQRFSQVGFWSLPHTFFQNQQRWEKCFVNRHHLAAAITQLRLRTTCRAIGPIAAIHTRTKGNPSREFKRIWSSNASTVVEGIS